MIENNKMTIDKLAMMVANGFKEVFGRFDSVESRMATMATKDDLATTERRLVVKIESVGDKLEILEEADVKDLQGC